MFASLYATLTYIVPFLQTVTGVSGPLVSAFLLAYGVALSAFTVSAAVVTGLVIACLAIPVAWAMSFLRPPAVEDGTRS